ncbi:MAG: ABC transporter permease [Acidobacteriales bacterium]|nr:ABC transporter permease [Terriglobales bacterium]
MNTPANAMHASPPEPQVNPSTVIPAPELLYWSVRREFWEYRSIYVAPLAVAGVYLFAFLISLITLPNRMRDMLGLDPMKQHELIEQPYSFAALLIMGITFLVGILYSLDALQGERRDRSILFWKSLPVSDLTTVLAKASIPIVVLPLLSFAVTVATQILMLLLSSTVLVASGLDASILWKQLQLGHMSTMLLYHLMIGHVLWYAPIYGYFLMVSAWARRAPILWASLPLIAINIIEKVAFNSSYFGAMLRYRFFGPERLDLTPTGGFATDPMTQLPPGELLSRPGLWIGLVLATVFLAAAVRLRRARGPI